MEWKNFKTFRVQKSAGKVFDLVFRHFLKTNTEEKVKLSKVFLHDNAPADKSHLAMYSTRSRVGIILEVPPYPPDLVPFDYHMSSLK